ISPALYERVVRVVSLLFIGSALIVVTVTGTAEQPLTYAVLAVGAFLIVLSQDIVPLQLLGRWRFAIEAITATVFVTLLIALTGGHESPFFFGYLLLLAGAAVWARGATPFALALLASAAYLVAVTIAPAGGPIDADALGRISFNLVALALISYVSAVVGREQRRAREAALRLSRFDPLTALYNRRYLDTAIEREILRASRSERPFSLLMIDLDGLKTANDQFGHEVGDRLLRATADAIRGGIRASDLAARYGGDEFVVVLVETDLAGALRVGEKLRLDISRLAVRHDAAVVQSSASLGLVSFPDDGRTGADLMRRADLALYEAKRRGRNQLVRFARPGEQPGGPAMRPGPPPPGPPPAGPPGTGRPTQPPAPWERTPR
ncbi:MAG: GGDEF domain-containing protein, partial [Chloroflexota bacterium]|nr:GGDEF domain-containing protein [Chloroflexota bacterium]